MRGGTHSKVNWMLEDLILSLIAMKEEEEFSTATLRNISPQTTQAARLYSRTGQFLPF